MPAWSVCAPARNSHVACECACVCDCFSVNVVINKSALSGGAENIYSERHKESHTKTQFRGPIHDTSALAIAVPVGRYVGNTEYPMRITWHYRDLDTSLANDCYCGYRNMSNKYRKT